LYARQTPHCWYITLLAAVLGLSSAAQAGIPAPVIDSFNCSSTNSMIRCAVAVAAEPGFTIDWDDVGAPGDYLAKNQRDAAEHTESLERGVLFF
jgi:hypothetical protein